MEQIPRDDWTDQDLLTRGEAAGRLAEELDRVEKALADPDTDPAGLAALRRRRDALAAARAYLDRG